MKLIAGNSNLTLAKAVSDYLKSPLTDATVKRFSDKEIFVEINENVRGEDVFFIQSTSYPANDHLMELLIAIDALKRGSARRITAVIPYFGYARQDRKVGGRTPITARLVADLLEAAGVHRVLTMELHAGQIQGFFSVPLDNLVSGPTFIPHMQKEFGEAPICMVSPDVGGVVRARSMAKRYGADLAIVDKRREKAGVSEVMNVIGDVKDKVCVLVDDIVDSGGTLCNAAEALKKKGASEVYVYVVHGVLSGQAVEKIENSAIKKLVMTDSIEATYAVKKAQKLEQVSISSLIGEGIRRIHEERSVSELFK